MKPRLFRSIVRSCSRLPVAALAAIMMLTAPVASNAQDTTSAIRGKIIDPSGTPVGGATVVVEDTRSGVKRNLTSNNDGLFLASRLLPGGPYRVTVNGIKSVDVPSISVGDTYNLTIVDATGCSTTLNAFVVINEPDPFVITFNGVTNVSCFGGADGALFITPNGGTPGYTFLWEGTTSGYTSIAAPLTLPFMIF